MEKEKRSRGAEKTKNRIAERMKICIGQSMRELMRQKPIEKIRITEICSAAGVERSTFYYHFKDKYDLVAWIFYYSAEDVDVTDVKSAAAHITQLKNDVMFYRRAYEDTSQNALWPYMLEYYFKAFTALAKERLQTDTLDPQLTYSIRLYCYGAVWMGREWILNDSVTPAETAVRMMTASMSPEMQKIFYEKK